MPLLIEGREPETVTVTVSVPPALRQRVFIYYGDASTFPRDSGYGEIEVELCGNKPRTIWPGGIRVRKDPFVLHLGRPQVHEPL